MAEERKSCFIIGNGKSRENFDLSLLQNEITFGCNAIYLDHDVNYLVAIDDKMIEQIKKDKDIQPITSEIIFPPREEQFEPAEFNPVRPRSNAGMNAMAEAIKRGYNYLYCLGFDFLLSSDTDSTSNIYEGHPCYGPETRTHPNDNYGRLRYLEWFCAKHKDVHFRFVFYNNPNGIMIKTLVGKNISGMFYEQLLDKFLKK